MTQLTELEELDIEGCTGLVDISPCAVLNKLSYINLSCCTSLKSIDALADLPNLEYVGIGGCISLDAVPESLASQPNLVTTQIPLYRLPSPIEADKAP